MNDTQIPPDVRNGGTDADQEVSLVDHTVDVRSATLIENRKLDSQSGNAGEGTQDPHTSVRDDEQRIPSPHSYRFVVERGGGSSGTAFNKMDHEVIDMERKPGNRIVARATRRDAILICTALNLFGHIVQR